MTRKNSLPKFPDSYLGTHAEDYNTQRWMERNQKNTTVKCVNFLHDEKLGVDKIKSEAETLILDMGCGTGYSSEILLEFGFRVIGLDILIDMISKANEKRIFKDWTNLNLILGDIKHLPFRKSSIDHSVSISAYNFIMEGMQDLKKKKKVAENTGIDLKNILKKDGRIIIEFYPENEQILEIFSSSFVNNGFDGFLIKDNPKQKGGKSFLLLKKE